MHLYLFQRSLFATRVRTGIRNTPLDCNVLCNVVGLKAGLTIHMHDYFSKTRNTFCRTRYESHCRANGAIRIAFNPRLLTFSAVVRLQQQSPALHVGYVT